MEGGGAKTDNEIRGSKLSVWQSGEGGTRERRRRTWPGASACDVVGPGACPVQYVYFPLLAHKW